METTVEKILVSSHKVDMIAFMAKHPKCFKELITLTIADKQPYSWRASWLLWGCMTKNDPRIKKHIKELIHVLPNRQDNQQRELLKILHQVDIPEELEGVLFDHCIAIWEKVNKQASVRFNAFKMMSIIAKRHPELQKEIILMTKQHYTEHLSPAVMNSISRLLKGFR